MLERLKEGIEVQHEANTSKEKRNEKRLEAIGKHFDKNVNVSKNRLSHYLNDHLPNVNIQDKLKNISFENANPRNNHFMNELAFAGEGIVEGFLDCFNIQRDKALEKYLKQLQVIEKIEGGEKKFYVGTFKNKELMRATPYKNSINKLNELISSVTNQQKQTNEQTKQVTQNQSRSLSRRKEEQ